MPVLAPYADSLALAVVVVILTYVSLIFGELVPKRLALTHAEQISSLIARPMQLLATAGRPLVDLLSVSTDAVLRLLGVRPVTQPAATVEEIKVLLGESTEEGVLEPGEHQMVTNVLNLDDRHVTTVLTPRTDVIFLDVRDSVDATRDKLRTDLHAVMPLCDGGLDHILGVVRSPRVLSHLVVRP